MRKYAPPKSESGANASGAVSDSDSIQADTKSMSSFNESFNTAGSTSIGQTAQQHQQQLERELAVYKERYQTAEQMRLALTQELQEVSEKAKENVKKLVQDKMSQEERMQTLVSIIELIISSLFEVFLFLI